MDADLFERWFAIADQDHDGVVSGSEAVEFFQRSNLSQETLFQVILHPPPEPSNGTNRHASSSSLLHNALGGIVNERLSVGLCLTTQATF